MLAGLVFFGGGISYQDLACFIDLCRPAEVDSVARQPPRVSTSIKQYLQSGISLPPPLECAFDARTGGDFHVSVLFPADSNSDS